LNFNHNRNRPANLHSTELRKSMHGIAAWAEQFIQADAASQRGLIQVLSVRL